jgi:bifunctional non-homologous end joining protein LigD
LAALAKGLEGIVAKKMDSPYRSGGRSSEWLKVKNVQSADCIVVGYTRGEGNRKDRFGALLLGLYDGENLVYVGRVGTGFTEKTLRELMDTFLPMKTSEKPIEAPDIPPGSTWLRPEIVAEIGYQNLTEDNRFRAARFLRLRSDKTPGECTIDQVKPVTLHARESTLKVHARA